MQALLNTISPYSWWNRHDAIEMMNLFKFQTDLPKARLKKKIYV
jgi:hypothetical protein